MVTLGGHQKYDMDLALKQFSSSAHNKTKQKNNYDLTPRELGKRTERTMRKGKDECELQQPGMSCRKALSSFRIRKIDSARQRRRWETALHVE